MAKEKLQESQLDFRKNIEEMNKIAKKAITAPYFNPLKETFVLPIIPSLVTAAKVNELANKISDYLININSTQHDVFELFKELYKTLAELDKGYMNAIQIDLKAALKASKQAREAGKLAQKANKGLENTVKNQGKIIDKLEKFKKRIDQLEEITSIEQIWAYTNELNGLKNKLESIIHLCDIDSIWNVSQTNSKELALLKKQITVQVDKINNKIEQQKNTVNSLFYFKDSIESYRHLKDIDIMWDKLNESKQYEQKLKNYKHLPDIDLLWNSNKKIKEKTEELQRDINKNANQLVELKQNLESNNNNNNNAFIEIRNKLKFAYALAGTSCAISILVVVLSILGAL